MEREAGELTRVTLRPAGDAGGEADEGEDVCPLTMELVTLLEASDPGDPWPFMRDPLVVLLVTRIPFSCPLVPLVPLLLLLLLLLPPTLELLCPLTEVPLLDPLVMPLVHPFVPL